MKTRAPVRDAARSCRAGFTIIELLVVIGIIVVLIAILIPATMLFRRQGTDAATRQFMSTLATGLHQYASDMGGIYPPQVVTYADGTTLDGAEALAQGLLGYMDSTYDGAGPAAGDGQYGFRLKRGGRGQVYGPYAPTDAKVLTKTAKGYAFVDGRGRRADGSERKIYYFRAVPGAVNGAPRTISTVFGAWTGPMGINGEPAADTSTNPPTLFAGLFLSNGAPNDPAAGSASFYKQLGLSRVNDSTSGVCIGQGSFILVSPGADGLYFTDNTTNPASVTPNDDIILSGN